MDLWRNQWQRLVAIAGTILGALFLFIGWWGVSGADLTTEQVPYLASGAVGGLFLLGLAATLWLSADLRDEYLKLDDIHQVVEHLGSRSRTDLSPSPDFADHEPELVSVGAANAAEESADAPTRRARPVRPRKA
jgi:hypothetical protein